jgi:membrane-bound lytic murein transglycosylase D
MRLKAGSTVLVPKTDLEPEKDIAPELVDNATMAVEPDLPDTRRIWVKVGKRDSLASIAQRNKVSVSQIKAWNNLKQDRVAPGQTLQLNVPYKPAPARKAAAGTRQVARPASPHRKVAQAPVHKGKAVAKAHNSKHH